MKKCAIIGFGCGGYHAAKALRESCPDCQIDVYSNTDTSPANPMLTTYYVAGKLPRSAMFPFGDKEKLVQELNIRLFENTAVTKLSAATLSVGLADGSTRSYDDIVLASGSHPLIPPIAGMPEEGIFVMRTPADADRLAEAIEGGISSALVIGASWVGIKVIEALHAHKVPSTLVDMAPRIFCTAAYPETAEFIHSYLEELGIRLRFNCGISAMRKEEDGIVSVFNDGSEIKTQIVALCLGLRPTIPYVDTTEIEVGRGVRVDAHMRSSVPHIYAVGDCCEAKEILTGDYAAVNLWANAARQGRVAGRNIAGFDECYCGNFIHNITHFLDMEFIGMGDIRVPGRELCYGQPGVDTTFIKAVVNAEGLCSVNILNNHRISGIIKNYFLRRLGGDSEPLTPLQKGILMKEHIPEEFIERLEGLLCD